MGTMIQGKLRSWSTYSAALAGLAFAFSSAACVITEAPKRTPLNTAPDEKGSVEQPTTETNPLEPEINRDSGAFGKPSNSSSSSGSLVEKKFCEGDLKAGDLAVVEIMISSKTGSGDSGEWAEVRSMRDCWLHLDGVTVESPRGTAGTDVASVDDGVDLAPGGTFVVADSDDKTKNHGIEGTVISWEATDVLKNDGDTISVKHGELVIDKTTYPSLAASKAGNSVAFPADCDGADRGDWLKWAGSTGEFGTLKATPNAPNDDVVCQ
jgi:hypothetical protein